MDVTSSLRSLLPYGRRSIGINQLVDKLEAYLPPEDVERVQAAYDFAFQAHDGQRRRSGEPYITHPVAVADLLADLHLDAQTLIAAILHDVMEDTPTVKDEITTRFGVEVAELVDGVSKLDQIQFKSRAEAQAESFRKMLLAMVRDIRVIMVKLADRTHNMRTLGAMPPAKRRAIARETLEIYAPIANRLGMHGIKVELEDLGFRALYPRRYKVIETAVRKAKGNQKQFVARISVTLEAALGKAVDELGGGGATDAGFRGDGGGGLEVVEGLDPLVDAVGGGAGGDGGVERPVHLGVDGPERRGVP
jgi:GTP pyrophosphokinase